MGLRMATPYRHPKTKIFWLRQRTPAELVKARDRLAAHGIRVPDEVKISLRTPEPGEAKRKAHEAEQGWNQVWTEWRRLLIDGPRVLTQKEVFALSAAIAERLREHMSENPGDPERRKLMQKHLADIANHPRPDEMTYLEAVLRAIMPKLGLTAVAPASIEALTRQFAKDAPLMAGNLAAMAEGDYSEPMWLTKRPKIEKEQPSSPSPSSVTFKQLLDGWRRESDPTDGSVEAYEKRVRSFTKFLGHEHASRVTREDAQRWKREMQAVAEPNAKGINVKLDAVHTLFAVAINNGVLKGENPVRGLRIKEKRRKKVKARRGFTDAEARTILKAARGKRGFLRWAPWLMAYSGMRVGEIAQLRRSDVTGNGDKWAIAVMGEAGTIKTEAGERIIPVYSAVVREGFPAFVAAGGTGRLFPELYREDRAANTPRMISRRGQDAMRRWIRGKLGIVDPKIGPDHSWRHWFHTQCRNFGVDLERRKAIVGHAPGDVGGGYGDNEVEAMRRELEKIEPLDLEADATDSRKTDE